MLRTQEKETCTQGGRMRKNSLCIKVVTENVNEVDTKRVNDSQLFASMLMDNNIIKFQTDCGAACNITPISWLSPDTKCCHYFV